MKIFINAREYQLITQSLDVSIHWLGVHTMQSATVLGPLPETFKKWVSADIDELRQIKSKLEDRANRLDLLPSLK